MRTKRMHQMSICQTFAEHDIGQELNAISGWLDRHVEVLDWAEKDIQRKGIKDNGRSGMSIEAILRCGLIKQHQQWTYEELAFHLSDSATPTAFARLPRGLYPTDSTNAEFHPPVCRTIRPNMNELYL